MWHAAACCPSPAHASRAVAADRQEAPHCGVAAERPRGLCPLRPAWPPARHNCRVFAHLPNSTSNNGECQRGSSSQTVGLTSPSTGSGWGSWLNPLRHWPTPVWEPHSCHAW